MGYWNVIVRHAVTRVVNHLWFWRLLHLGLDSEGLFQLIVILMLFHSDRLLIGLYMLLEIAHGRPIFLFAHFVNFKRCKSVSVSTCGRVVVGYFEWGKCVVISLVDLMQSTHFGILFRKALAQILMLQDPFLLLLFALLLALVLQGQGRVSELLDVLGKLASVIDFR